MRVFAADGTPVMGFFDGDATDRGGVPAGRLLGLWEEDGMFTQSLTSGSNITPALPEGSADAYATIHDKTLVVTTAFGTVGGKGGGGKTGTGGTDTGPYGVQNNDPGGCGCFDKGGRTVEVVAAPTLGQFVDIDGVPASGINPDGTFRYQPNPASVGEDLFTYRIVTADGAKSDPIPVSISVTNSNPAVTGGLTGFLADTSVTVTLPGIDADPQEPVGVTIVDGPVGGTLTKNTSSGGYQYDPYTPGADFDYIEYRLEDAVSKSTDTGLHMLAQLRGAPTDRPQELGGVAWGPHDRPLTGSAPAITPIVGVDGPIPADWVVVLPPSHGKAEFVGSDGTFVYTPDKGFTGADKFGYKVIQDGKIGDGAPVFVSIVNQFPVTRADAFQTVQGDEITRVVYENDTDADNDKLSYANTTDPEHGTLTFSAQGQFTYTPEPGWYGHDKFKYTAFDGIKTTEPTTVWVSTTPRTVGDRVWLDTDRDGLQGPESSEPGVSGVQVELLDGSNAVMAGTSTDSHGHYGFRGLEKNTAYRVRFLNPDQGKYKFAQHVSEEDSINSDGIPNEDESSATTHVFAVDDQRRCDIDCGMTGRIDIDADINRNGQVEDINDEVKEDIDGTIVVRNADSVYKATIDPSLTDAHRARRREIVLRNTLNANVQLDRSGANVVLYTAETGGNEIQFVDNKVVLQPGSYWLQGGSDSSQSVRSDSLAVRAVGGAVTDDSLPITVIWIGMNAKSAANESPLPSPQYDSVSEHPDGYLARSFSLFRLNESLGVARNDRPAEINYTGEKKTFVSGVIHIIGSIAPTDLRANSFSTGLTNGFHVPVGVATRGTAEFGFVMHRDQKHRLYYDAVNDFSPSNDQLTWAADDSERDFQDPHPDVYNNASVVTDVDGPGFRVGYKGSTQRRFTAKQWVGFTFYQHSERGSSYFNWSTKIDAAMNYDGEAVFIKTPPNSGAGTNIVATGGELSLDLGAYAKPTITAATVLRVNGVAPAAGDQHKLPRGKTVDIEVVGSDLIGLFRLVLPDNTTKASNLLVYHETQPSQLYPYSDASKVIVSFTVPDAASVAVNAALPLIIFNKPTGAAEVQKETFNGLATS